MFVIQVEGDPGVTYKMRHRLGANAIEHFAIGAARRLGWDRR
jgi:hypothetical protein